MTTSTRGVKPLDLRRRKDLVQIVLRPIPASVCRTIYIICGCFLILMGLLIGGWNNTTTMAFSVWFLTALWTVRR